MLKLTTRINEGASFKIKFKKIRIYTGHCAKNTYKKIYKHNFVEISIKYIYAKNMHQGKNMYISKIRTSKEVLGVPFKEKKCVRLCVEVKIATITIQTCRLN